LWPGNGILAIENTPTDKRAQVFRQGYGSNEADYLDFYASDTITHNRLTIFGGIRYDRQWGKALPSTTKANPAFPNLVPGLVFTGYDAPFKWNNVSPHIGVTYAVDPSRKTVVRASYSRYAGQLNTGTVGYLNPSSTAGSATYKWNDVNGDHFAQATEVDTSAAGYITAGGGFNPANPSAVTSANQLDPNLKAPITQSVVVGADHEVVQNLAVTFNYSYGRTSSLFGNFSGSITPRVGVVPGLNGDYSLGSGFSGTLPDGTAYNIPTYIPNAAKVAAGGNGFLTTNIPGYYTDYHGIEIGLIKRLSSKFMTHAGFGWNNARDHFQTANGIYDTNGNPTPTLSEPLKAGGQFAPQSGGSGSGSIYTNAKWQFNANGLYQAPYGIELSANVFGRQGYPYPLYRQGTTAALGADSGLQILVTPAIDSLRYPNLWNTDFRIAKQFKAKETVSIRGIFDVFNVFNSNTALVRNNNIASPTFNTLAQNLSPRIARVGLVVGF
jgi:outer membrane receptor for Fe3+-dicitrate